MLRNAVCIFKPTRVGFSLSTIGEMCSVPRHARLVDMWTSVHTHPSFCSIQRAQLHDSSRWRLHFFTDSLIWYRTTTSFTPDFMSIIYQSQFLSDDISSKMTIKLYTLLYTLTNIDVKTSFEKWALNTCHNKFKIKTITQPLKWK